jgi:hypothetical protein
MLRRRRTLLLAMATTLLVAAPTASASLSAAQRWPVDGPAMQQARQIAIAHWGMSPCNGDVPVAWARLAPDENGRATWTNPFHDYGDPAGNTRCSVALNTAQDWTWPKLCTVLTHEFGHLAGNSHSDDPDNVMYAYYTGTNVPCGIPGAHCASARSPDPCSEAGVSIDGVSRRYHSASKAAWQPDPAAVIAWR